MHFTLHARTHTKHLNRLPNINPVCNWLNKQIVPAPKITPLVDPVLQYCSFDWLKQFYALLKVATFHMILHLWSQGCELLCRVFFLLLIYPRLTLILLWMVSITKPLRTRFLRHNRAYQTCKTGTMSDHNVILCSARLKCNYLSSNAKLSSVSLNLPLILINAALVFDGKPEIMRCDFFF